MIKKYYIFGLTFFCMLIGQQSYSQDYTINEAIDIFFENNPDYVVNEIDTQEYIDILNNDSYDDNDFIDTNLDGQIDEGDDLYRQSLINNLGWNDGEPVTCTNAELQAIFDQCVNLREVVVVNNYHDPQFDTNGFYSIEIGSSIINHWESMTDFLDQTWDEITTNPTLHSVLNGLNISNSTKSVILSLAEGDVGYLKVFVKSFGAVLSAAGILTSLATYTNDPTTANLITLVINIASATAGPGGGFVMALSDATGLTSTVAGEIGSMIDNSLGYSGGQALKDEIVSCF